MRKKTDTKYFMTHPRIDFSFLKKILRNGSTNKNNQTFRERMEQKRKQTELMS